MTDPNITDEPFAAPSSPLGSPVVASTGQPGIAATVPSPRPATTSEARWVLPVLVATIIVVVSLVGSLVGANLTAAAIAAESVAHVAPPKAEPAPTTSATPSASATPVATECPPACLGLASAGLMIPNGSLQLSTSIDQLLVTADFSNPTTAAEEYRTDAAAWAAQTSLPAPCFFIASRSPISPGLGGPDAGSSDPVTFLGENANRAHTTLMTQSARFLPDSASASDYLRRLTAQAASCHVVHPAIDVVQDLPVDPILQIPGSVSVLEIVEKEAGTTTRTFDLRRANAVVRFRVVSNGSVTEATIRRFLSTWATTDLAQLDTTASTP